MRATSISAALVLGAALLACAPPSAPPPTSTAPPAMAQRAPGYLAAEARPNSAALLPPPPPAGSPAQARDKAASQKALTLRGSARWTLATQDAELKMPDTAKAFSCAVGVDLSPEKAPHLFVLLDRAMTDFALTPGAAKAMYKRPRPFTINNAPICTPDWSNILRNDGSYPSGHSTIGWGLGLILAEIAPDRTEALIIRARAFGQSRVVCNVHWLSDVEAGRVVADATLAKLHADAQFQADLAAAHTELQALRAAAVPSSDCAAETAALAAE